LLVRARRLLSCVPAPGEPLGAIDDGALVIEDGRVVALGAAAPILERYPGDDTVDHPGLVTPGLVDAHTHAAWVGSRADEYVLRMQGADYETIAKAGGGIVATMVAVRGASVETLGHELAARLSRMASLGVTSVEVKSGYGLDEPSERRQLEAVASLSGRADLPQAVPTFLGLHALPPEARGDRAGYLARVLLSLDGIARDGLARFVDVYVDRNAFSVAEARPFVERARALGLGVRMHAGQFADVGGAELAAEVGAASVDHLEQVSEEAIARLAAAAVRVVLLPIASFTLRQAPPPIDALRRAPIDLVVASDANPGTAPSESLPLALALAVRLYGLSPAEALLGATRHAAASLGIEGGYLAAGTPADVVLWDHAHEHELMQPWGVSRARRVLRAGVTIYEAPSG
jgi:imidazolonepropionase